MSAKPVVPGAQARPRAVTVASAGPTPAPEGAGPGVRRRFRLSGLGAQVRTPPSTANGGRRDAAEDRGQCPAGPATSARCAGPSASPPEAACRHLQPGRVSDAAAAPAATAPPPASSPGGSRAAVNPRRAKTEPARRAAQGARSGRPGAREERSERGDDGARPGQPGARVEPGTGREGGAQQSGARGAPPRVCRSSDGLSVDPGSVPRPRPLGASPAGAAAAHPDPPPSRLAARRAAGPGPGTRDPTADGRRASRILPPRWKRK